MTKKETNQEGSVLLLSKILKMLLMPRKMLLDSMSMVISKFLAPEITFFYLKNEMFTWNYSEFELIIQ